MPTSSEIATLVAETAWLTRLARSLTGDAAEADDAVQETFVAALRSPPDAERPPRPWLRRVLVNVIRMRHRGRTRQAANESIVEPDAAATPDHLLDRARLERRITKLVLELPEPYRTTVLLRYREGISAEAIAHQQGIPAGTVRRRLKTALDRLRRELDDREGPAVWRAALVPFVGARPISIWRIVMAKVSFKAFVVAALLFLLAIGAWHWRGRAEPPVPTVHRAALIDLVRKGAAPAMFAQPGVAERVITGHVTERACRTLAPPCD